MRRARSIRARASVSAAMLALLLGGAAGGAIAQEESPAPSPEPTGEQAAVPISEEAAGTDTAPKEPNPVKDNTFALGQSLQIRVDADGQPNSNLANFRWSVSQLTVQGPADGSKDGDYQVPVPEGGTMARYLTQFGRPSIDNGVAAFDVAVKNGSGTQRTVSLFPQDAEPVVALKTRFTLNGEEITAKELVGKSGVVTAQYTLVNNTSAPTEVTVNDLAGNPVTKTVEADVPMIGIAKTLLPQRYVGLNTGAGQFGADGRGNNQVQWIALPFKPLSKDGTATFGWSANVTDAVIPSILLQVAPVYLPGGAGGLPGLPSLGGGGGSIPVNLDPAIAEVQAGVANVLAGVTALTESDGTDPLQTVQDRVNTFFTAFGTNLQTVSTLLDPNNPDSVTALLAEAVPLMEQISGPLSQLNENWDLVTTAVGTIARFPGGAVALAPALNGLGVPDVPPFGNGDGNWTRAEAQALIDAARALEGEMARLGGAVEVVAPLVATLTPVMRSLLDSLTELTAQLQVIGQGLQETNIDLPSIDAVISSVIASFLASPEGQQITGGLNQVSTGIGLARAEVAGFLADVIVQVRALAGRADTAAVDVKASVAGLVAAAGRSPLVYGPLPEGTPPGTVLAGAYEFRIDAADTNLPYTPWRILVGVLFVVAAVVVGMWAQKRRSAAEPPSQAPA